MICPTKTNMIAVSKSCISLACCFRTIWNFWGISVCRRNECQYYDHNRLKHFIRGIPVRFAWSQCGISGCCFNPNLCCGKDQTNSKRSDPSLVSKVVSNMLECVDGYHCVFFGKFVLKTWHFGALMTSWIPIIRHHKRESYLRLPSQASNKILKGRIRRI